MTKKILSALLCVLLITALFPLCAFADGVRYTVKTDRANILKNPSLLSSVAGELKKGDCVFVSETDGDFSKVTQNSTGITGWVYAPMLSFSDKSADTDITEIGIFKKPDKLVYIQGEEEFDSTGLVVYSKNKSGSQVQISGYKLYIPDFTSEYGEKTVYVTYTPENSGVTFSTSFNVTVTKKPIKSLSVEQLPSKPANSYIENQTLDLSGLKLRVTYSDGREDSVFTWDEIKNNSDFIITGCHSEGQGKKLSAGKHTVNIYYMYDEINCSIEVTAVKKGLVSLEITSPPTVTCVYAKEVPDLSGLELTAYYDNGESTVLSADDCTVTCEPEKFILGNGNTVTVSYGTLSVDIDFTYALYDTTGIQLKLPQKLTFVLGEEPNLSALEVYILMSSGETVKTEDYTRSPIELSKTGAQTVTVTSGEYSATFTIYINPYYQRGDVDGDGKISAADARIALRTAVGYISISAENVFSAADADSDGNITAADARLILRASVGLEDFLSAIKDKTI